MKSLLLFVLLFPIPAIADQTVINNFAKSKKDFFWPKLYPTGGSTLYCGQAFTEHYPLDVEHVYSASWMAAEVGCSSRTACRTDPVHKIKFNHMEADLHNLFPALAGINRARSNNHFGIIEGEARSLHSCDAELNKVTDTFEPRLEIRGDVARAIFYMHDEYGISIPFGMAELLKEWHFGDPPSTEEIWRNERIEQLQNTRNKFIDDPSQANNL